MNNDDDIAVGSITVASTSNDAVVVNGGMVAKSIVIKRVETETIKIRDSLSVLNNVLVEGNILPFSQYSTAQIGSIDTKWNDIHTMNINCDSANFSTCDIQNANINNVSLSNDAIKLTDSGEDDKFFNIDIDNVITTIEITSDNSNHEIDIILPDNYLLLAGTFKKLIIKQTKENVIRLLSFNQVLITITGKYTCFDMIYIMDKGWNIIKYSDIDRINNLDAIVSEMNAKLSNLIDFNNFVTTANPSENSLLDFIDKNKQVDIRLNTMDDVISNINNTMDSISAMTMTNRTNIASEVSTINNKIAEIVRTNTDNTNTINTFKTVANSTFTRINETLNHNDIKIAGQYTEIANVAASTQRNTDSLAILTKKIDSIAYEMDAKMKLLSSDVGNLRSSIDIILHRMQLNA